LGAGRSGDRAAEPDRAGRGPGTGAGRNGGPVAWARRRGSKGVHVVLGRRSNLQRTPLGGRHFECYSEEYAESAAEIEAGFSCAAVQ